jgi:chemotaxis protein MotB
MNDDSLQEQQPIIVRKKKGGHGGHGGSWKVAYADFVTSMMAFFMVMWLLSQADNVKESVAGYFQDPQGFKDGGNMSVLPGSGKSILDLTSRNSITEEQRRRQREMQARKELKQAAAEIMKKLRSNPSFERLRNQIEVQMTAEGLRIQLLESAGESFFERGSAEIKPTAKVLLAMVAEEVGKLDNPVIIEGHTDSYRYSKTSDYSNWELSVDRCNSARKWMASNGLHEAQIEEIRGYADNQPKVESNPGDPRNRRIAIIVANQYSGLNYLDKNIVVPEEELLEDSTTIGAVEVTGGELSEGVGGG